MNSKAFTLIELLVVVAIIVIFSGIAFVNYGPTSNLLALDRSAYKLVQDLRLLEEVSLGVATGSGVTGYLMYFDKAGNQYGYKIYADKGNNTYDAGDTLYKSITLENGIKVCTLKDNGTDVGNTLNISSVAPNPKIFIQAVNPGHDASIVLCLASDATQTRTIKINSSGRVDMTTP